MKVDFWFDASCPWTWATSRWLADATAARGDEVRWRPYSLPMKNGLFGDGPPSIPEQRLERAEASHGWARVVARVAAEDEAGVGPLYTELGRRVHHDGQDATEVELPDALAAAGLDPALASSAGDGALDAAVQASIDAATALVGDDVGVPVLAVDGSGVSGPILSPVPSGDAALRLYDAVLTALGEPGFFELKRTRDVGPALPHRS